MGVLRRSEAGYDQTFSLIAKRLREDGEQVTQEPMPTRWVDLILYLDEQERKTRERAQRPAYDPRVLEAERRIAVRFRQPDVVKHRANVKQLGVVLQALALTG